MPKKGGKEDKEMSCSASQKKRKSIKDEIRNRWELLDREPIINKKSGVYFLFGGERDKQNYTGSTNDIKRRLHEHNNNKGANFTHGGKWEVGLFVWERLDATPDYKPIKILKKGKKDTESSFRKSLEYNCKRQKNKFSRKDVPDPIDRKLLTVHKVLQREPFCNASIGIYYNRKNITDLSADLVWSDKTKFYLPN